MKESLKHGAESRTVDALDEELAECHAVDGCFVALVNLQLRDWKLARVHYFNEVKCLKDSASQIFKLWDFLG